MLKPTREGRKPDIVVSGVTHGAILRRSERTAFALAAKKSLNGEGVNENERTNN